MFDINAVLDEMRTSLQTSYGNKYVYVQSTINNFLTNSSTRLQTLANKRIANEVDDDFVKERVIEETDILKGQLLVLKLITQTSVQDSITNILTIFLVALKAALLVP